jgi:hypothetical protein
LVELILIDIAARSIYLLRGVLMPDISALGSCISPSLISLIDFLWLILILSALSTLRM